MTEKGYNIVFDGESCKIFDESNFKINDNLEFVCTKKEGLYCDNISEESVRAMSAVCVSLIIWHKRLGHLSQKGMRTLKNIVLNIMTRKTKYA